jgi:hypothetical protein
VQNRMCGSSVQSSLAIMRGARAYRKT